MTTRILAILLLSSFCAFTVVSCTPKTQIKKDPWDDDYTDEKQSQCALIWAGPNQTIGPDRTCLHSRGLNVLSLPESDLIPQFSNASPDFQIDALLCAYSANNIIFFKLVEAAFKDDALLPKLSMRLDLATDDRSVSIILYLFYLYARDVSEQRPKELRMKNPYAALGLERRTIRFLLFKADRIVTPALRQDCLDHLEPFIPPGK